MGRKPLLIISLLGTVVESASKLYALCLVAVCGCILDGLTGGNTSIATAVISDTTVKRDLKRSGYLMLRFVWVRHRTCY